MILDCPNCFGWVQIIFICFKLDFFEPIGPVQNNLDPTKTNWACPKWFGWSKINLDGPKAWWQLTSHALNYNLPYLKLHCPKKRTKYIFDKICPSFVGKNFVKYFVWFFVQWSFKKNWDLLTFIYIVKRPQSLTKISQLIWC